MIARRVFEGLRADVSRDDVARLLGYPPGPLPDRVDDMVREALRQSSVLIRPSGCFALLDATQCARSPFLGAVESAAVALVTIGDGIERAVDRYRDDGLLAPALVFDAVGSAAAEAAADAADRLLRAEIESAAATPPVRCSRRFSPGYGGWDVAEQRWILELLDGPALGVDLTPGCMMTPRKSVTFAVTIGAEPVELRGEDVCATCGLLDCRWRGTPQRCEWRRAR